MIQRFRRPGTTRSREEGSLPGELPWVAVALMPILVSVGSSPPPPAAGTGVASPGGRVVFTLEQVSAGRIGYRVTAGGAPVVEPSPMVFTLDGVDLAEGAEPGRVERYRIHERYAWRGVHDTAVNHANGMRVAMTHKRSGAAYTLDVRAFDGGVAFRTIVPASGTAPRVPDERTTFAFPAGSTVWYHDFENHYESVYTRKDVADVQQGEWAAPPVTVQLPGARGYAAVTEGGLTGYSGMGLQANGRRGFDMRLGHAQPLNYPFRLRYGEEEGRRLASPAAITGGITTPWRIVMVAADLDGLVNSDLVHNLAPPPSPPLADADWIRPGRSLWRYLDGGDNSFEGMKGYARMAAALGFEYNLLEGFWQKWPESQLRELVDYSRSQGVGLWLWKHSRDLRTPEARQSFFELCRRAGVVGAKIDFFDHEHREVVELYEILLREAAAHRLMLNFHGANKPTGESRTWPNELTREAVYGFERGKTPAWATHNTTLPFTRYLAGHADYTPVVFGDRRRETSWAHQIATAAVFTSPLLVYGAHPQSLLDNPAVEIIRSLPATWSETRVLPVSAIGEIAAFARRSGTTWFLAIVNGAEARTVKVPLAFLGPQRHAALLARDRAEAADALTIETAEVGRGDTVTIALRAGGGFIGRFVPAKTDRPRE